MGNWHNVLRAINMASGEAPSLECPTSLLSLSLLTCPTAKLPKPQTDAEDEDSSSSLPQTLVRIPTEHAPALQAQTEQTEGDSEEA